MDDPSHEISRRAHAAKVYGPVSECYNRVPGMMLWTCSGHCLGPVDR